MLDVLILGLRLFLTPDSYYFLLLFFIPTQEHEYGRPIAIWIVVPETYYILCIASIVHVLECGCKLQEF